MRRPLTLTRRTRRPRLLEGRAILTRRTSVVGEGVGVRPVARGLILHDRAPLGALLAMFPTLLPSLLVLFLLLVLELLSWVAVLAARPPVAAPGRRRPLGGLARLTSGFRRRPELTLREVLQLSVRMTLAEALKRR
jgi:hypothetical protein